MLVTPLGLTLLRWQSGGHVAYRIRERRLPARFGHGRPVLLGHPGLADRGETATVRFVTPESVILLEVGRSVLSAYTSLPGVACAAITGSSAEGHADRYSDLDMTVYYDVMPPERDLRRVREQVSDGVLTWSIGHYADGEFAEAFRLNGVEVQIGHTTVARWEATIAAVRSGEDPGSPAHKAMSGTLVSIPVFGAERLAAWQETIRDYPDVLRLAMVKHHLKFFRVWALVGRLATRDAALWFRQMLVESSFNLLGVSAGLSRRYFTSFQFKRARAFIATLDLAPSKFADRLEMLWTLPPAEAAVVLQSLVADVVTLVERELPEVDTAAARKALASTDEPWET
jgi:hypothetical protein